MIFIFQHARNSALLLALTVTQTATLTYEYFYSTPIVITHDMTNSRMEWIAR